MEKWLDDEIEALRSKACAFPSVRESMELIAESLDKVQVRLRRRTVAAGKVSLEDGGWMLWLESDNPEEDYMDWDSLALEVKGKRIRIILEEE